MNAADLLAAHLDNTPLAVIEWDDRFRVTRWSGQAEAVFGFAADEVVGRAFSEWAFVHAGDAERVAGAAGRLLVGAEPRNVLVNRNLHKSGRIVWCEWHNSVLLDGSGAVRSVLSLVLDVTDARAARADTARGWDRLRAALQLAGMIGWQVDRAGGEPEYSTDLFAFAGPPDPAAPGDAFAVVHPADRERVRAEMVGAASAGRPLSVEYRGFSPAADGGDRHFVARGRTEPDPDGGGRFAGVTADVTARKRAEAERAALDAALRDARQREAIGLLAAGVAHDFNNILTVILGSAGMAKLGLPATSDARARLDAVEAACVRAGDLCRQMAAYAGVGRVAARPVDPARVVADARPALLAAARPPARVVLEVEPCPAVRADPELLALLLANLVTNAAEALPGGGEVRVSVRAANETDRAGFDPPPPAAGGTVFAVADAGRGMTAAVRARAFEPFFSTKFTGRGLGLAAVQGIARSHGGSVRVTTAPGTGTTVEVFLPALPGPVTPPAQPAARARGLALVVDDEANIRELVAAYLEDAGYAVHATATAADGLALLEAAPTAYAVVVSDLSMPGSTGEDLAAQARALSPQLPVVLMTGHADPATRARLSALGAAVLEKPFRAAGLLAAVAAAGGSR